MSQTVFPQFVLENNCIFYSEFRPPLVQYIALKMVF